MKSHHFLRYSLAFLMYVCSSGAFASVILQYHHIDENTPPSTSISPSLFRAHLEYLEEENFVIWPLPKLVTKLKQQQQIPDKVVVITFDDAYDSIYKNAFPLLKQRGWPFTVFTATQLIDSRSQPFMTWDQLRELAENGATIANHTQSHAHLVRKTKKESKQQWLNRVRGEIENAQLRIEKELGATPKLLAYPYGEFTNEIADLAKDLGYTAFGQQSGGVDANFDLGGLPRFPMTNIFGAMKQFKTKVASLPLPAALVTPGMRIIKGDELTAGLQITFKKNINSINCFFAGQPLKSTLIKNRVSIASLPDLPVGRSRINCTAPSDKKGRYHWFSYFWMRLNEDGSWYTER